MPNQPKTSPLRETFLAEIAEELGMLEGADLDQFLVAMGEDPDSLTAQSDRAMQAALAGRGKQRLEQARARVQARKAINATKIMAFDVAKKRALLDAIRIRGEQTGDMTLAARNRRIESESDLNSFLEACLRLGVIDESGELKD